jgi:hypothetical protein
VGEQHSMDLGASAGGKWKCFRIRYSGLWIRLGLIVSHTKTNNHQATIIGGLRRDIHDQNENELDAEESYGGSGDAALDPEQESRHQGFRG